MKKVITTEEEMKELAIEIGEGLEGGEIIALEGDLGAGKTFFTQQLAHYLGVKDRVASPTFVLMKQYTISHKPSAIRQLVHIDCYRLDDPQELYYLGVEEYINHPEAVVVIEWADRLRDYIKSFKKVIWIKIELEGEKRVITVSRK